MRWIFADRKDSEEAREIAMLESKIADWWEAFSNKAPEFAEIFQGKANWDLPEWMIKNLNPIHEELMWEFGAAVNGPGDRLVITPESRKELRPLVESIISEAPELPGWEFYTYRLAEDLAMTAETVRSRVGTSIEGVEVAVEREEGNRIALKYVSDKFRGSEDNEALNIAFVATETLLGEKILDHWIGEISVAKKKKGFLGLGKSQINTIPLADLKATVDREIKAIEQSLPEEPCYERFDKFSWSLVQLKPTEQEDYPERSDMLVHTTTDFELLSAALKPGFASERYSRHRETFCYLKIDGAEGLEDSSFADRGEIEEAINAVLIPAKSGCTIGGGTGLRYSYIDLALLDFVKTSWKILEILRAGRLPNRTWLLFSDADYRGEWIGLYDDTPEPPREAK